MEEPFPSMVRVLRSRSVGENTRATQATALKKEKVYTVKKVIDFSVPNQDVNIQENTRATQATALKKEKVHCKKDYVFSRLSRRRRYTVKKGY
jgi:hypothetical protein